MRNYKQQKAHFASDEADSGAAALGNATELRTPPLQQIVDSETGEVVYLGKLTKKESISQARFLRFKLQNQARKILYGFNGEKPQVNSKGYEVHHRTCTCTRFLVSDGATLLKANKATSHHFGGLMNCANSRTCPICAAKINEHKANEMRQAANLADEKGVKFSLLTFTAPHTASDSLDDLIKGVSGALSGFFRGAPAKRFKEKYGIIGYIRSFEIRYGSNGWHPHFHLLIVSRDQLPLTKRSPKTSKPFSVEKQSLEWQWVLSRWQSMCIKHGLNMPNEYGLDIQNGGHAGQYITKFGSDGEILATQSGKSLTWDMADEVTKGHVKMGRKGSLSPWDLLSGSIDSDSDKQKGFYRSLFLDYARAVKGVTILKWSRGLRDFFGLKKEETDEEIIENQDEKSVFSAKIPSKLWRLVLNNEQQALVIDLIDNGGVDALATFLYDLDYSDLDFDSFKECIKTGDFISESVIQLTNSNNKNHFNAVDIADGQMTFGLSFLPNHVDLDLDYQISSDFNPHYSYLPSLD